MIAINQVFKCSACGDREIVELRVEAVVRVEVVSIDNGGLKVYRDVEVVEGHVEGYECMTCGVPVDLDELLESEG